MVHMKYCSFFLSIIQEGGECEANLHIYRMDSDNDGIYYKYTIILWYYLQPQLIDVK